MKISILILIASVIVNIIVIYLLFNASVSLDHSRSQSLHLQKKSELAINVLNSSWKGKSIEEVNELGESLRDKGIIYKSDVNSILIGEIKFNILDNKVTSVSYFDI